MEGWIKPLNDCNKWASSDSMTSVIIQKGFHVSLWLSSRTIYYCEIKYRSETHKLSSLPETVKLVESLSSLSSNTLDFRPSNWFDISSRKRRQSFCSLILLVYNLKPHASCYRNKQKCSIMLTLIRQKLFFLSCKMEFSSMCFLFFFQ